MTKDPRINSRRLDEQIDRFLGLSGVVFQELSHCVRSRTVMRPSPLVSIGNHSLDHYVLSSLSPDEQAFEIQRNHEIIVSLGLRTSKMFSIPFGGDGDFNDLTIRLIRDLGYSGFLYSRGLLNLFGPLRPKSDNGRLPCAERYMVPPQFDAFQRRVFKLAVKSVKHRFTSRST
jgi:peptidoglycan/xylan/chitin deacetylase (PgdA/CDA1 family)